MACVCGYEVFFCLFFVIEVAVLDADEFSALVEEGRLQPMGALAVGPRGEAAPSYYARVEPTLVEEERPCLVAQPGMLEVAGVTRGVKGVLNFEF